jgi:hypothetical protein
MDTKRKVAGLNVFMGQKQGDKRPNLRDKLPLGEEKGKKTLTWG